MTNEGDAIEVNCLGTNPPQGVDIVDFNDNAWSYLEWQGGAKVVEVSLNAQQTLHHYMAFTFAKHFKRDCRIYRFPTTPLSRRCDVPPHRGPCAEPVRKTIFDRHFQLFW